MSDKTPCIIMDIDGTLANADHRIHLLVPPDGGKKDWEAFLAAAPGDSINPEILALNNAMSDAGYKVFVCTGRNENTAYATTAWLKNNGVQYDAIAFRAVNDRRDDVVVKKEMLDSIRESGFEILFAVEDRKGVTKMWRENGVRCLQVCEGDY